MCYNKEIMYLKNTQTREQTKEKQNKVIVLEIGCIKGFKYKEYLYMY